MLDAIGPFFSCFLPQALLALPAANHLAPAAATAAGVAHLPPHPRVQPTGVIPPDGRSAAPHSFQFQSSPFPSWAATGVQTEAVGAQRAEAQTQTEEQAGVDGTLRESFCRWPMHRM